MKKHPNNTRFAIRLLNGYDYLLYISKNHNKVTYNLYDAAIFKNKEDAEIVTKNNTFKDIKCIIERLPFFDNN